MADKKDDGKVKAIRQGIVIKTEEDTPEVKEPVQSVVDTLRRLTAEAEKGNIQEFAYSVCGEVNEYDIVGFTTDLPRSGFQIRGLLKVYDETAYPSVFDEIFLLDDFED